MKKYMLLVAVTLVLALSACTTTSEVNCGKGTVEIDGKCEVDTLDCNEGYHNEEGLCVADEENLTCDAGYHEENDVCVVDELVCDTGYHDDNGTCVIDAQLELPDWFDGCALLNEPVGNKTLNDLTFTETGFSVYLSGDSRVGIIMNNVTLEPGYYYEVSFDYSSDVAGKGIFVQLQGHGGYEFTNPGIITSTSSQTFSQLLPFPPESPGTTGGWMTIELTPSIAGTVTIENIELVKTALPTCGDNQVLSGIVCIAANNGFLPNGIPTEWFTGWEILTVPTGNKDISDYEFLETGFTAYLGDGERLGI